MEYPLPPVSSISQNSALHRVIESLHYLVVVFILMSMRMIYTLKMVQTNSNSLVPGDAKTIYSFVFKIYNIEATLKFNRLETKTNSNNWRVKITVCCREYI